MGRIEGLEDLRVYRAGCRCAARIFELTETSPRQELYALTDEIRRSSRSVGANLAEGWRKRRYPKAFIRKLDDGEAEAEETRHWIATARHCGYLDTGTAHELDAAYDPILGQLVRMSANRPGR